MAFTMLYQSFTLLLIVGRLANADSCNTPDNEIGKCQPITECQQLLKLLTRRPLLTSDINFLQKSTCGFVGPNPKVCCPLERLSNRNFEDPIKPDPFDFQVATSNLLPTVDECGLYNPFRTFGRDNPDLYEFPWVALLHYNNSKTLKTGFFCGGVLISKKYVLTAGNCIQGAKKGGWNLQSVRLGEYNLNSDPDCIDYGFGEECGSPVVNIEVEKVIFHENFSVQHHDIALIRLKTEVEFSDFIQPICLPLTNQELSKNYVGKKLFVAGWSRALSSPQSKTKLKDQILVRNSSDCSSIISMKLTEHQLCASGEEGQTWCKGDIGGPLMAIGIDKERQITRWYAIGVSSYGVSNSCGAEVYTKVSKYVPWIVSKLES